MSSAYWLEFLLPFFSVWPNTHPRLRCGSGTTHKHCPNLSGHAPSLFGVPTTICSYLCHGVHLFGKYVMSPYQVLGIWGPEINLMYWRIWESSRGESQVKKSQPPQRSEKSTKKGECRNLWMSREELREFRRQGLLGIVMEEEWKLSKWKGGESQSPQRGR